MTRHRFASLVALCASSISLAEPPPALPTVTVTADDTVITHPCRVVIPPGTVIIDANHNGVLHIAFDTGTVEFAPGSLLRGSPANAAPDTYTGTGIRIKNRLGVTIRNAHVSGFKIGLHATATDDLTLDACRFDDLWRQRLKSTPQAEDQSDWLWPHENDAHEWRTNYGAAACIERAQRLVIRACTVRRGQNGFILDRVENARVIDNDASFLSGWGLALWRSSHNLISRNAFDFCIRGYSHGVYNRGQDSAGILAFEQCSHNRFVENSATHGGDGFFGFAGKEALGEKPAPTPDFNHTRMGCNDNLFHGNDFSYAAAHGLELTFSFGNIIRSNRFIENAICGIWGGYSSHTRIDPSNIFTRNGQAGYGLERGAVNIEHGSHNTIGGTFDSNACGVHLWWDQDPSIAKTPWAKANSVESAHNLIVGHFKNDTVAIHLRNTTDTTVFNATFDHCAETIRHDDTSKPEVEHNTISSSTKRIVDNVLRLMASPEGDTRPVGARAALAGRQNIIMTEWGPWDHASPLARRSGGGHDFANDYDLFELPDGELTIAVEQGAPIVEARATLPTETDPPNKTLRLTALSTQPGVHPYAIRIAVGEFSQLLEGTLINWRWDVTFFPSPCDPREDLAAWRAASTGDKAITTALNSLKLRFKNAGPSQLALDDQTTNALAVRDAKLPHNHFGTIARTIIPLTPGTYRLATLSDDGLRVRYRRGGFGAAIGGKGDADNPWTTAIENWTHHGPTRDTAEFTIDQPSVVEVEVEHFELDGFAVLEVTLDRVD